MSNAFYNVPKALNEPVLSYRANSPEKIALKAALRDLQSRQIDVPMWINGERVTTANKIAMRPPHNHQHILGYYSKGDASHVQAAIDAALAAKPKWEAMPWQERAAIFLKAADLLAGPYRAKMNATTMLAQSKNAYQAEIDAVAELCDFFRFNVQFMTDIYKNQPESTHNEWNRLEHRPLEGFVFALTPFNFTSIAGNLPTAPALMGNTIVWKASETQIYSANIIVEILEEAGLPKGVINLILVGGAAAGDVIFKHPEFAGIHFTGGTGTFNTIWKNIAANIDNYKSYPRIVGETGGKDFIVAHPSSNPLQVATAMARGAFEYQGQKCSAASRAYIPSNIWNEVKTELTRQVGEFKMGSPDDFSNFINAVIDEKSFDSLASFIDEAHKASDAEVIIGGTYDKSVGYFIAPTVIVTSNPNYTTMCTELFGPVLTVFVYDENKYLETLALVDKTSPYALTGAVFSREREGVQQAFEALRHSAGNFYINDKPTGAVVGRQPFGGARASGTNDKAGSTLNLLRWVSPRAIKETFVSPTNFTYPFMEEA